MTNSYLCAVCARLGTVPTGQCHVEETPRASGLWRSLSLVSVPCGPWFCVGQKGPTVETGRKLRLFTTTAVRTTAQTLVTHPLNPITKATARWACRYKKPTLMGKSGTDLL